MEVSRLLEAGVAGGVFPGAAACVVFRDKDESHVVRAAAGRLSPQLGPVSPETRYDLASLTKPFVATCALRMVKEDIFDLDVRAEGLLNDVRGWAAGGATLEDLLSHRSSLAAWGGLYLDVPHEPGSTAARRWILSEASRRSEPRESGVALYSDLGYMIAGAVLERAGGGSLDSVVRDHVTEPLGISDEVFFVGGLSSEKKNKLRNSAAPTERDEWRDRLIRGEVHDENCAALGGVSGHAGMFGSAAAVARLGVTMLDVLAGRSAFLPKELAQRALADRPGGTIRTGWDTKGKESSAGRHFSDASFGHLGFTGTSIWCDPKKDLVVVLLSNRVHPSRANEKIRGFRPAFHDGVYTAVFG